jgi:phenylpyruvate tautomerase PptA (4-oxalocrotonate tautomerase family)
MPLVRIDMQAGRTPAEVRRLADVVQDVMLEFFAAPAGDRYQIITEHPADQIIVEDSGLGLERTDGVTVVHIVQQGRDRARKERAYAAMAERLESECGVRPADLVVSVTENTREDWSFGLGRAQFLTGEL